MESSILGDHKNYFPEEDLISEELSEYSDTVKDIHKDLWGKYHTEQSYKIKIGMSFKEVICGNPFDGYEYDTEVTSDYEVVEIGVDITPYLSYSKIQVNNSGKIEIEEDETWT